MDSNKQQNMQVNSFDGGMNTDVADHLIKSNQYRLAKNLRFIQGRDGNTGELKSLTLPDHIYDEASGQLGTIVSSYQIRDYGILFVSKQNPEGQDCLYIYRFDIPKDNSRLVNFDSNAASLIFGPCTDFNSKQIGLEAILRQYSIVGRVENNDNMKLYLADGEHQIMIIDLFPDPNNIPTSIKQIESNNNFIMYPPKVVEVTYGNLKAGMNQYSYQLYRRYKQATQVSPLTKIIPIVNKKSDNLYDGVLQGNNTNMGIKLRFNVDNNIYDTIKIFRVRYDKIGEPPEIDIIYEGDYDGTFEYIDYGGQSLGKLTVEEYNSLSGIHIIPRVIEAKDDYLFAAQIKEKSVTTDKFDDINTISLRFSEQGFAFAANYSDRQNKLDGKTINDLKANNWKLFDDTTRETDCFNIINDMSDLSVNTDVYMEDIRNNGGFSAYTYLFQPKDNGIIYYGGVGKHIDWRFVVTQISGDGNSDRNVDTDFDDSSSNIQDLCARYIDPNNHTGQIDSKKIKLNNSTKIPVRNISSSSSNTFKKYYIDSNGMFVDAGKIKDSGLYIGASYNDPIVASNLKSLRRGELYRYGIIFTDSLGNKSNVKWITDIRVPGLYKNGFNTFEAGGIGTELGINVLGVEFRLHDLDKYDIAQYEIVRCNRTINDISIVSQGVVSRPVKRFSFKNDKNYPYTPNFILSTNKFITSVELNSNPLNDVRETNGNRQLGTNIFNDQLYQFLSPEFSFTPTTVTDIIKSTNVNINTLKYLFPNSSFEKRQDEWFAENQKNTLLQVNHDNNNPIVIDSNGFERNAKIYDNYSGYSIFKFAYDLRIRKTGGGGAPDYMDDVNNVVDKLKTSKLVFKYYNQAATVTMLPHRKGFVDNITYKFNGKLYTYGTVTYNTDNICEIKNLKFIKGEQWDNFGTLDSKGNSSLKYIDQINIVGTYQFCNWVIGGIYGLSVSEMNAWFEKHGDVDYVYQSLVGPGSSGLLIQLNSKWKHSDSSQLNSEIYQLTDTIGSKVIEAAVYDNNGNIQPGLRRLMYSSEVIGKPVNNYVINAPKFDTLYSDYDETYGIENENNIYSFTTQGTYLCNIVKECIPYGGYEKNSIENSLYYSYSDVYKYNKGADNVAEVFNGDTYICPFEYVSLHKFEFKGLHGPLTTTIVNYIPVETSINLMYTSGTQFINNSSGDNISWIQEEPGRILNHPAQDKPQFVYNTAYSSDYKLQMNTIKSSLLNKNDEYFDYRCRYSNKKENGELQDSWTTFLAANYIDVSPDYGKITELKTFKNSLVFFQERAFGLLSVNERTTLTDNNSNQLLLGSGGILDRYDYISTTNGMEDGNFSDIVTNTTLYWIDYDNKEYCQYSGGNSYSIISRIKGVQKATEEGMYDVRLEASKPKKILYNSKYNEVMFWNGDSRVLVYNDETQLFHSVYTISANVDSINYFDRNIIVNGNDSLVEFDKSGNIRHNDNTNTIKEFQLKYVINEYYQQVKVFDNIIFNGSLEFKDNIKETFATQGQVSNELTPKDISQRYYDYRAAIPRASNVGLYGNRMRGKSMECDIKNNIADNIIIQYITTKYRALWS